MNIATRCFALLALSLGLLLSGCATMKGDNEQPKVDVLGIEKTATDTSALQFTIKLRIVNPNEQPINLSGIYYELSLEGIDIITGTAKDLPPIAGFSEEIVSVSSAASMISSARLIAHLINDPQNLLNYELRAKLGTTSKWMPATTVVETGEISLK